MEIEKLDFSGEHVVVTGATGALGDAVVETLLVAGAHCHVPCRSGREIGRFRYSGHERVTLVRDCDLTVETSVARLYDGIPRLWAAIHLAGGFTAAPLADTSKADFVGQIDVNLMSCFLCSRAAIRRMALQQTGGRIVNVAARPALEWRTGAGMVAYTAAKAAVAAMTVSLAEEVAKDGILVNAVAPSIIDTPANRQAMPNADHGAWPKPLEIAATIAFLASRANRATRGSVVPVYGKT